jgi:hypothetical protein
MPDERMLVRPAELADVGHIAGLFRLAYQQTSHPCANPQNIATALARGEKWLVCEKQEGLVSCTALIPHHWNATYEAGRSVTHDSCQGQGVGRRIYRDSLQLAMDLGEQDFVFGWPRSAVMCRMMCLKTSPPTHLFGHDGGANIANGIREIHAVGFLRTVRTCRRAEPLFGPASSPLFRDRISQLHFQNVAARAPTTLLVGPRGDHNYQTPQGLRLCYSRTETTAGWSVLVSDVTCEPGKVTRLLASFLADHSAIRYLACYVLWDKTDLIDQLSHLGFQATAYLPGWYLLDGVRHDCFLLSVVVGPRRDN